MLALELEGNRYDIGDEMGFIKANLEIGLANHEINHFLYSYLKELVEERAGVLTGKNELC